MQKSSREKLRQIWRPNQVKVTLTSVSFYHTLANDPKLCPRRQWIKPKTPKDCLKHFCLQRKPSLLCLAKRMLWHGKGGLQEPSILTNSSPGFSSSLPWSIHPALYKITIERAKCPWWWHLQTRLSRERPLLAKKEWMELHFFGWGFLSFLNWDWFHFTHDFLKTLFLVSDKRKRSKSFKGEIHPPEGLSIHHISWNKWFSLSTKRKREPRTTPRLETTFSHG